MQYDAETREWISRTAKGRIVKSLEWVDALGFWVMTFTDGSEIAFRFLAELVT